MTCRFSFLHRMSLVLCSLMLLVITLRADPFNPKEAEPKLFKNLRFRNIGPAAGGRICRVAGVPGEGLTYYAATASGGLWKSVDGGLRWNSIMDETESFSIGSIAIAKSNPNVLYVGTGEANIRGNVCSGDGIFKSVDVGRTWKHVWKQKAQIGTIIVHPTNPDICFAAVLGHAFGPSSERGVYRTTDGGQNWQRVLFKDDETGASDVCMDPNNPHILFAGLWQTRRRPWDLTSGGPGSGLYVSRDGGTTWQHLQPKNSLGKETGLPDGIYGRIGVAVAASDSHRVYALIEAEKGGLYRSDDGGVTWQLASDDRRLRQRAWYYTTVTVDPTHANIVYCPQVPMLKSIDGGKTFETMSGVHHGDNHDIWIDPANPKRMIVGNDGGVSITVDGGGSWYAPPLPISQFYRINICNRTPYHVGGTMQDLGAGAAPSNSLTYQGIRLSDWYPIGGDETGYVHFHPKNPFVVYAGEYAGIITRFDTRLKSGRNVSIYPDNPSGHGGEDMRYRFRWPAPIAGSPHDAETVYHAANVLFRTRDGGRTWDKLSEDLTRNDKSKQKWSGGPITGDNTTAEFFCTISTVVESPKQPGVIWVGTDDGLLHLSQDHGKNWKNLTEKLPDFPEWATIKMIEASQHEAGTAYVVIDAHLLGNTKPYLFKTTDFGETWQTLSETMPTENYLHVVREDAKRKDLLFAGYERGVYFSTDAGRTWQKLKLNLPPVPVHDMIVRENDLILGTNGRSIWILDDISPLRAFTPEKAEAGTTLLEPAPAIRWRIGSSAITDHAAASFPNPEYGAILHYYLKKKPEKELKLVITDTAGNKIVAFEGKKDGDASEKKSTDEESPSKPKLPDEPGLHRFVWDLAHDGARAIPGAVADMGSPVVARSVNPGTYTVTLTVDGTSWNTSVKILQDPRIPIQKEDLLTQEKIVLDMRSDLNLLASTVESIRAVRNQFVSRNKLLMDDSAAEKLIEASKKAIEKLDKLEEELHNPKAKIAYDILAQKGGAKLYSRLIFLYNCALDDGGPTQGELEVYIELKKLLKQILNDWNEFKSKTLVDLNNQAKQQDAPIVVVPKVKKPG